MSTQVKISPSWEAKLANEFEKDYFLRLIDFVKEAYQTTCVYPPGKEIFSAFDLCSFEDVKVVILGQDPYHGPKQANGLCFSVRKGIKPPPSLVNIFNELSRDLQLSTPTHGDLSSWAKQGVLLLNATLTVEARKAGSHQNQGWETFTDAVIELISQAHEHVVFMLWGAYAQRKGSVIDAKKHLILQSAHPSPFSVHRGFSGNAHFSQANTYLASHQKKTIDWQI